MKKSILSILIVLACTMGCKEDGETCSAPPTVSAGEDITITDQTSIVLAGTTSEGEGKWTIAEGAGGEISSDGTHFKGLLKSTYKLKWEATNACGTSEDFVTVNLKAGCGGTKTIDQIVESIHWIQQACFRIEAKPFTIYTDPNSITKKDTADIILISHPHGDHFAPAEIDKLIGPNTILIAPADVNYTGTVAKRVTLTPGQEYQAFDCVTIKAVPAYNVNKTQFHPKSNKWVGYLVTVNGVTFYHAGDTERISEMKTFTCDIAMLPLGQTYTFDTVADAVESAKDVKAKVAIPMHFGLYEGTAADALSFKNLLDGVIPVVIKEKGL